MCIFKWIGGGLGWALGEWFAFGGPLGGVIGFIIGTVIDSFEIKFSRKKKKSQSLGIFSTNLLMLIAAVMKVERPVAKAKVDMVKIFLKQNFGEKVDTEAFQQLRNILRQNIPLDDVCTQIRNNIDYSSRLQLTHFFYNLASSDGRITDAEQSILNIISRGMKVPTGDKYSVGTTNVKEDLLLDAYKTLGVHLSTNAIDIKKAYRSLATKYHPDKVAFLGEEKKKSANDKFQQLTQAYEIIKKNRNFT